MAAAEGSVEDQLGLLQHKSRGLEGRLVEKGSAAQRYGAGAQVASGQEQSFPPASQ